MLINTLILSIVVQQQSEPQIQNFVQTPFCVHFCTTFSEVINISFNILQDLKVPKKDGGSRRGSFNPAEGAAGGEEQPEVSK